MSQNYFLGIDIGSTTVKYLLCDSKYKIIAKAYVPHQTKQTEKLFELLKNLSFSHPTEYKKIAQVYLTGSGASRIAPTLNGRFIQEVNAVVLAVEHHHPDVHSVIELGGQDAKIIHFKKGKNGKKTVLTKMNDKCASGTGAIIEKCSMKVGLNSQEMQQLSFNIDKLHPVAAKCGVFAETDIVNLIKSSIPSNEIMNSLADAIVMQNLTVLTQGNTLLPNVLLLGGPNTYLPFLQQCWQIRIADIWDKRGIIYNKKKIEELIYVPENSQYYAALGAIIFGRGEKNQNQKSFNGLVQLKTLIDMGTSDDSMHRDTPLVKNQKELELFKKHYTIPPFVTPKLKQATPCFLGIDGGSTSTKAVLVDEGGRLLLKVYQISKGNPIQDTLELLEQIKSNENYPLYEIKGLGVTGYAADVLEGALNADINIIETIAHMKSSQRLFTNKVDVICDVGGEDIKVLFMENGMMKNFRLSNQCSAGNGALLQSMAKQFGVAIEEFAEIAFLAKKAPKFNYGCAVFLDSDRVNFQKEGYTKEELFAGIAKVLPKNIWQYVVQTSNLSALGKYFVLQGGTQYNQAALKAQVDYIKERVPHAEVYVHPFCGEAGAYGAAIEAKESIERKGFSTFVGMNEALQLSYTSKTDASTTCHFCSIHCSRTFIESKTPNSSPIRYIAGFACENGTVELADEFKTLQKKKKSLQIEIPNLVQEEAHALFAPTFELKKAPTQQEIVEVHKTYTTFGGWGPTFYKKVSRNFIISNQEAKNHRKKIKIAIPKVLNIYTLAPFLRSYLEALGINALNIQFSNFSNEKTYQEGAKYGSVDSCYPAKVAQSHVYSLMFSRKFAKKSFDYIWFPSVVDLPSFIENSSGDTACPVITGTPKVVFSSFTKEVNLFKKAKISYVDNALNFAEKTLLKKQLFNTWNERLYISEDENNWAVEQAWKSIEENEKKIMAKGRKILDDAVKSDEIVLLLLARPYHSDPGINHKVLDAFQELGFKILSMRSIPKEKNYLKSFFEKDIDIFDINDVWIENYSTNSSQKVWAAKFAARHPNIAVVDLSSFKCGHDAPTYTIIDKILGHSRTPHLTLHDIDANKPSASIKIRIKTFSHTLKEYARTLKERKNNESNL